MLYSPNKRCFTSIINSINNKNIIKLKLKQHIIILSYGIPLWYININLSDEIICVNIQTINSLSAVGLFLGFFVNDIFTKLWNVGLLKKYSF